VGHPAYCMALIDREPRSLYGTLSRLSPISIVEPLIFILRERFQKMLQYYCATRGGAERCISTERSANKTATATDH